MIDAYLDTRAESEKRWSGALVAAVALHLTVLGLAFFLYRAETPEPVTDRAATEIVWLPTAKTAAPAALPSAVPVPADPSSLPVPHVALFPGHLRPRLPPVVRRQAPPAGVIAMPAAPVPPPASVPQPVPKPESAANLLWENQLLDRLMRLKRYPFAARRDGQQDTVMVHFVIDREGQVLSSNIIKSQGFALLDHEARALIRRASPLPAPPTEVPGNQIAMVAPIQFVLAAAQ